MIEYRFDKCPKDKLPEIIKLCEKKGMWKCEDSGGIIHLVAAGEITNIIYDSRLDAALPLTVQLEEKYNQYPPKDEKLLKDHTKVKDFFKEIVRLTGTEHIYIGKTQKELDISLLK